MSNQNKINKHWQLALFALGVSLCLIGAFLMFDGSILGEDTTGIATVIGITGISLISSSTTVGIWRAKKQQTTLRR